MNPNLLQKTGRCDDPKPGSQGDILIVALDIRRHQPMGLGYDRHRQNRDIIAMADQMTMRNELFLCDSIVSHCMASA